MASHCAHVTPSWPSSIRQIRIARGYPSGRMEPRSVEPTERERARRAVTLGAVLGLILVLLARRPCAAG